jgi:vacuolar protein sorting-associated protein 51
LIRCPEIRQLGSERQSLVYNHHHELIAASDTIAAVCLFLA